MRRFLYILALLLLSTAFYAQEAETGIVSKLERRESIVKIIGEQNDSIYVLKKRTHTFAQNSFSVEVMNSRLNPVRSIRINVPNNGEDVVIKDVFLFGGTLFVFYELYDKNNKTVSANLFNLNTKTSRNVREINYVKSGNLPDFSFEVDSARLLLVTQPPFAKYTNHTFFVDVFDPTMNKIIEEQIEFPYPSKNFSLEKVKIKENNIFFLGSSGSEKELKNPHLFYIIRYNHEKKSLKEFELNLKGKWITSATFQLSQDSSLYVGGFYSNDRSFSIAGTFFLNINLNTNKIDKKSLKAFSDSFLSEFLPPRKIRKGGELQSFYFDHFIVKPNGGAVFVAEQYYKSVSTYTDIRSGMINYTTNYFYNDIILVSVNANGDIEWNVKVPKQQYSTNDSGYYLSYALTYSKNTISILFNDHPRNIGLKNRDEHIRYMNNPYRAVPLQVSIDEFGTLHYKKINLKTDPLILRPKIAYTVPYQSTMIIVSEKGRNFSLTRAKL